MNLHNLSNPQHMWVWLYAEGRNGHALGTHLWRLAHGTPAPLVIDERRMEATWWLPARFSFRPFWNAQRHLENDHWTRPLCGQRSASRYPRLNPNNVSRHCPNCELFARAQGIEPTTVQTELDRPNGISQHLVAELRNWRTANNRT